MMIKTGRIKKVRQQRGYTQEEMAEKLGIPHSAYAKVEGGKQSIGAEMIFQIAKVLDEPVESFWEDSFNITQHGPNSFAGINHQNYYACPEDITSLIKEELKKNREDRKAMLSLLERLAKK